MDLVALPQEGTGTLAPTVDLGIGPADLHVAVALIFALAVVYLLDGITLRESHRRAFRRTLTAGTVALLVTYGCVVLYTSITLL